MTAPQLPSDPQSTAHGLQPHPYRGRFAPSPTGRLHFGSLVAAVGSYLQARQAGGKWLVRIEDLDPPRTVAGAAEHILHTLDAFGFTWDEPVLWQSQRNVEYEQALSVLIERGLTYPCSCTRSDLQQRLGEAERNDELFYAGRCAHGPLQPQGPFSWRLRVAHDTICFEDALQGERCVNLQQTLGDFVIKRRDGWFAYQLAVVVDDAAQAISEVVRGADLLMNTPRQIALQRALGLPTPRYVHLPLATDGNGNKLAKATAAAPVDVQNASMTLWQVLAFLRQAPPVALQDASLTELWQWAVAHWTLLPLRTVYSQPAPG